jgi:hypothetical protein
MRALMVVLALAGVAHAGKAERAVKKAGFTDAHVVAKGTLWIVDATKRGETHRLIVDPKKGKVLDTGEGSVGGMMGAGESTVTIAPFLEAAGLWDVVVSSAWSNGMGGGSVENHYIVRAKRLTLACMFAGSSSDSMEDASSSSTVTIERQSQEPLGWTLTIHDSDSRRGQVEQHDRTVTYTLGARGACQERE